MIIMADPDAALDNARDDDTKALTAHVQICTCSRLNRANGVSYLAQMG